MIKRILAGAAAVGFALSLLAASPASAHQCSSSTNPNDRSADKIANTTSTGYAYGKQTGQTGGYIGTQGGNGWIEAGGANNSAYVKGHSAGAPAGAELDGYIDTSKSSQRVCVNNTRAA